MLRDDILISWEDDDGSKYCLHRNDQVLREITSVACDLIHSFGTSDAVWAISGVMCKAMAWVKGMETEAETVRYVRERFDFRSCRFCRAG